MLLDRHLAAERGREQRLAQHRLRRAHGDLAAGGQEQQPVAHLGGEVQVVGDEQDRDAALAVQSAQQGGRLRLVPEIEVGRRLVEDEEPRLLGERPRHRRALALAAAQAVEPLRGELEHAGRLHRGAGALPVGRALEVALGRVRIAPHQDQLLDRERELGRHALRDHGDPARELGRAPVRQRPPLEEDPAGVGRKHPGEQADQRRLAGAVRAEHADDLAGPDLEREVGEAEGARLARPRRGIGEADAAELDERRAHTLPR